MAKGLIHDVWDALPRLVGSGKPVSECMLEIASMGHETAPDDDRWLRLQDLDYDADVAALQTWIPEALEQSPPPQPLHGLFFPLIQYTDEKSPQKTPESSPCYSAIRVAGSSTYVPTQGWCGDQVYEPPRHTVFPKTLLEISRIEASVWDLSGVIDYVMPLVFVVTTIRSILAPHTAALINPDADAIGVVAGWEDGDFYEIGQLTPTGFRAATSTGL